MNQRDFFQMLGAPLVNFIWSWGSVRKDETVFLRVWKDQIQKLDDFDSRVVQIYRLERKLKPRQYGRRERLEHIERIKRGARCFLVMCEARDVKASKRTIHSFEEEHVFRGGKIKEKAGKLWIEVLPAVPVREVLLKKGKQ